MYTRLEIIRIAPIIIVQTAIRYYFAIGGWKTANLIAGKIDIAKHLISIIFIKMMEFDMTITAEPYIAIAADVVVLGAWTYNYFSSVEGDVTAAAISAESDTGTFTV